MSMDSASADNTVDVEPDRQQQSQQPISPQISPSTQDSADAMTADDRARLKSSIRSLLRKERTVKPKPKGPFASKQELADALKSFQEECARAIRDANGPVGGACCAVQGKGDE
ncbi:hypothetical protein Q7P35_001608 [Cladosporium inversicolor]